ncbi:hypothetical protein niasHT_019495 [Heterodera trifolii]|uniref:Glutathione synthetase n=1 Tax=Heterodera trifolii TaxID=157864 RepID=A0ABD2KVX6_9BILA
MFIYKTFLCVLFVFPQIFHSNTANETLKRFKPRDQKDEVIIRLIRDEDIDETAEIIQESYLQDCLKIKHATPEQCKQMKKVPLERTRMALSKFKAEKDGALLVAETTAPTEAGSSNGGARLLGCIRVKLNSHGNTKDNGPFAQIGPFATRDDVHGLGIGKMMLEVTEEYAVKRWNVCEMGLDAHGIPEPVKDVVHPPMTPLLEFYEKRGYRRIGKTNWFDPSESNYVRIPNPLTHLERMMKDTCLAKETSRKGTKRRREEEKGKAPEGESSGKRKQMHQQHDSTELIRNYAAEAVKSEDELAELVEAAVDLAHEFGLIKRLSDYESRRRRTTDLASIQPFCLFPSPFPRSLFLRAIAVHKGMQKLFFRVSCDYEFLTEATEQLAKTDKTYERMVGLMDQVRREGQKQPYTLLLTRADYVMDNNSITEQPNGQQRQFGLKQTGMTIGTLGSVAMSPRATEVHRQMLQKVGMDASNVPPNRAVNTMARGLFNGWLRFGDAEALVVFIVSPEDKFRFDERAIENELQQISDGQIEVERMTSEEAFAKLILDESDFTLRRSSDRRAVALVHSSSNGHLPEWTDDEWEARRRIERSRAIKTSTVFSDLSTSKAVQQLLAQPGKIEQFMRDEEEEQMVETIRRTFVEQWPLEKEDEPTRQLIQRAIANPGLFVLKAQNEEETLNYVDEELSEKLQQFTHEERAAHELRHRIQPVTAKNFLVRPLEGAVPGDVAVELGIFGFLLGDMRDGSIVRNTQQGFIARSSTKLANGTEKEKKDEVYDSLNLI